MHEFTLNPDGADLSLALSCGQTFRWKKQTDGAWTGVSGSFWFSILDHGADWQVQSNAREDDLRRLFRLDSHSDFERAQLASMPGIGEIVQRWPSLRMMRSASPRETLFSFLCSSNNHISRITQMVQKLAEWGSPIEGCLHHEFPKLETLASITEAELRELKFGYRSRTIPKVAASIIDLGGEQWLSTARDRPYEEIAEQLRAMPGIGPKLADCIALFAFEHGRAVPLDTHMWRAAQAYYPDLQGQALTTKRYGEVAQRFRTEFGSLAGLAHHYMFVDQLNGHQALS